MWLGTRRFRQIDNRLGAQSRKHKQNLIGGYSRKKYRLNHRDYEGHSTETKANSRGREHKESAHMACLTNSNNQPSPNFWSNKHIYSARKKPRKHERLVRYTIFAISSLHASCKLRIYPTEGGSSKLLMSVRITLTTNVFWLSDCRFL